MAGTCLCVAPIAMLPIIVIVLASGSSSSSYAIAVGSVASRTVVVQYL